MFKTFNNTNITTRYLGNLVVNGDNNTIGTLIMTGGNIGIGTSVPGYTLDVSGNINVTGDFYQNGVIFSGGGDNIWDTNGLKIYSTAGNMGIGNTDPIYTLDVNGTFETSNANGLMVFASSGNLGIGNTAPAHSLHVNGGIRSTTATFGNTKFSSDVDILGTLYVSPFGRIDATNISTTSFTSSSASITNLSGTRLTVGTLLATGNSHTVGNLFATGGNVGVGTTSPSSRLHVDGDIFASGNITGFSDRRLKTDIVTIDTALEKVENLRGVYYTQINTQKRGIGVIAQEVREIIPEVVNGNEETGYLGIAYGNIVGLLIEAIKDLSSEVKTLRDEIETMKMSS